EAPLEAEMVQELLGSAGDRLDVAEPSAMAEQLPHRDRALARGRELGPVGGDRLVIGELPPVRQAVKDHRGKPLRRREPERLRLTPPAAGTRPVLVADPQV